MLHHRRPQVLNPTQQGERLLVYYIYTANLRLMLPRVCVCVCVCVRACVCVQVISTVESATFSSVDTWRAKVGDGHMIPIHVIM